LAVRIKEPGTRLDFVAANLGFYVDGVVLPAPDPDRMSNLLGALVKRVGTQVPKSDVGLMSRFSKFVQVWLESNLEPLGVGTDLSVDTWLKATSYPDWRQRQLLKAWADVDKTIPCYLALRTRMARCKSFGKREFYTSYKEMRCINSRSDAFKVATGPAFHAIEDSVYTFVPEFIKHTPVPERPGKIASLWLPGISIVTSDYTAFEALLTPRFMRACEMQLYKHMLRHVTDGKKIYSLIARALTGINQCHFGGRGATKAVVKVKGTRMSGDMCTSLGNGFSNLMAMSFACECVGSVPRGFVEGDDGIFAVTGPVPTKDFFRRLGLRIKLRVDPDPMYADFCGNVFDPNDKCNIPDVAKQLVKLGWSMSEFRLGTPLQRGALLRAKAISAAYMYAGCPVLQAAAEYILRCVGDGPIIHESDWARSEFGRPCHKPVGYASRLLLADKYGYTVELQYAAERWFSSRSRLEPMPWQLVPTRPDWHSEWGNVQSHDLVRLRRNRTGIRVC